MKQWIQAWYDAEVKDVGVVPHVATQAARWGADQELEACCKWLRWQNLATHRDLIPSLRTTRRPKTPSLKEQALRELQMLCDTNNVSLAHLDTIRRALEQLDD